MASDTKDMEDKIKKIDVNSPTRVLAQNAVLLPSGVARVKQSEGVPNRKDGSNPIPSGSATASDLGDGKSFIVIVVGTCFATTNPGLRALTILIYLPLTRESVEALSGERSRDAEQAFHVHSRGHDLVVDSVTGHHLTSHLHSHHHHLHSRTVVDDDNQSQLDQLTVQFFHPNGNPRNKTALAPGHSLMDWIRLGSSGVDLTGVGGVTRSISPAELAKHNKQNDAWIAIRGEVFNVSRYMDFHPGGIPELMRGVGKDATKLFDEVHAWVNYRSILHKCVVGTLSRGGSINSDKAITSAITNPTISSTLLSSCISKTTETEQDTSVTNVHFVWKQTTSNITFSYYVPSSNQSVNCRLTRISDVKHRLDIVFDSNTLTYVLDLSGEVKWPPTWKKNCEPTEIDFVFSKVTPEIWKTYGTRTFSYEKTSTDRVYRDYEVVSNTPMCPIMNHLILRAKDYLEIIPVGRHLEAKMTVMGMDVSRMYTPVPPCLHPDDIVADYTPDCICLMVKRYPDGALSPSVTALTVGQTLTLSNALGSFVVEAFDAYTTIHMLAAGTGLTAMLSTIQRALGRRSVSLVNLICFNKDEDNIFYAKELDKVVQGGRLKVSHILSRPSDSWDGKHGTVTDELLNELIGPCASQGCVFSCGPKAFMEVAKQCLDDLGWKDSQVYQFDD